MSRSMEIPTYRYISIADETKEDTKLKTRKYAIFNKSTGILLATVRWYGAWRQYCFFPEGKTLWSSSCLQDMQGFMKKLMEARRK